jgi:hypothetical protein
VCRQFKEKFPGVPVPQRNTVRNLVVRLRETGSFNDRTRKGKKKRFLTEEKITAFSNEISAPCLTGNRYFKSLGLEG